CRLVELFGGEVVLFAQSLDGSIDSGRESLELDLDRLHDAAIARATLLSLPKPFLGAAGMWHYDSHCRVHGAVEIQGASIERTMGASKSTIVRFPGSRLGKCQNRVHFGAFDCCMRVVHSSSRRPMSLYVKSRLASSLAISTATDHSPASADP